VKPELHLDLGELEPSGEAIVTPSLPLVRQLLDEFELAHDLDDDGDLVIRFESCSVYFFFYGERDEIMQARMFMSRRFDVDTRSTLVLLTDEWNRSKLGPKAFTVLPDDGMVGLCAEHYYDFEAGVTRTQLKYTIGTWLDTMLRYAEWMDQQIL
jgi:hypothetical protein